MLTTRFQTTLAAVAVTLVVAGSAAAANPKILELDRDEVIAGAVLKIKGADFSDVPADVKVKIGDMDALVLGAGFEELTVFVPNLKPGKHRIVVTIGSATSQESITLKVRKNDAEAQEEEKNRQLQEHETVGEVAAIQQKKFLELNPARVKSSRGETLIDVSGTAKYPDRCVIVVSLKLDKQFVTSVRVKVKGGRFEGQIGPFTRQLFAGNYAVEAEFALRGQPSRIQRQFNAAYKDPKERSARSKAFDRVYARLGSPEDERQHQGRIRTHFEEQIRRATELLEALDDNFCTTGRSIFRSGDDVQEIKWEEWLKKRSLRGLNDEKFRQKSQELAKERSYLTSKNFFDDGQWREWLDTQWRGDVLGLAKTHVEFRDRWAVVRYSESMLQMEEALSVLLRLSQRRSQELYTRNELPIHPNDQTLKGADVLRVGGDGQASPARFRGLVRKMQKELGLESR